jgi:hypothetical protein
MSDDMLLAGLATGDSHLALAVVRQSQRTAFDVALAVIGDLRRAAAGCATILPRN